MTRKLWTHEENEIIRESRLAGLTVPEITKLLPNRNERAVAVQASKICKTREARRIWTEEEDEYLLEQRKLLRPYEEIAEEIGRTYVSVKSRGSALIKTGRLAWTPPSERLNRLGGRGSQGSAEQYTVNDLLDYVRTYVSCMSCPVPIRNQVKKQFGTWTAALEAAGIPGNIGGKFNPNKATVLYLLDFGSFKKFGITQQGIKARFSGSPDYQILDFLETSLEDAVYFEKQIKQAVANRAFQPKEPWFERNGKTECFIGAETQLAQLL